jgi:hypothetical protein
VFGEQARVAASSTGEADDRRNVARERPENGVGDGTAAGRRNRRLSTGVDEACVTRARHGCAECPGAEHRGRAARPPNLDGRRRSLRDESSSRMCGMSWCGAPRGRPENRRGVDAAAGRRDGRLSTGADGAWVTRARHGCAECPGAEHRSRRGPRGGVAGSVGYSTRIHRMSGRVAATATWSDLCDLGTNTTSGIPLTARSAWR